MTKTEKTETETEPGEVITIKGFQFDNRDEFRPLKSKAAQYYPVKVVNKHWQLRDLVRFSSRESQQATYVADMSLRTLDLNSGNSRVIVNTKFQPVCLDEIDGIYVSGGSVNSDQTPGILNLCNNDTGVDTTAKIGSAIVNSVGMLKTAGNQYDLFVCNNDRNLYRIDASGSELTVKKKVFVGYEPNFSKLSQDKKVLAITGDSSTVTLVDPTTDKISHKIKTQMVSGFSIDFHHTDLYMAVGFQSGDVLLYDMRSLNKPLASFSTAHPKTLNFSSFPGAFRKVCFSGPHSLDDYLFVSEHLGNVHIIDMRDLHERSVLTVPSTYDNLRHYSESKRGKMDMPVLNDFDDVVGEDNEFFQSNLQYNKSDFNILGMDVAAEFQGSSILVGGPKSITKWEINSDSRRSFGDFEVI